jgi:hypothetical protein
MSTALDQLDAITRARSAVLKAEARVRELAEEMKLAKQAVKLAELKLRAAIDDSSDQQRQPRLPFAAFDDAAETLTRAVAGIVIPAVERPDPEPAARSWRDMTLSATGWDDVWGDEAYATISARVKTCGELADQLVGGETYGLLLTDLVPVWAAVEQISQDDETPIKFEEREPDPPPATAATALREIDGFPEAVADRLFPATTTVETLFDRVEAMTALLGDLPLRNKLVTFFVKHNCKLKQSEQAADAVVAHTGGPRQIVHCAKCKATYDAAGRDRCPSCGRGESGPAKKAKRGKAVAK